MAAGRLKFDKLKHFSQEEMERYVKKIVDLMISESLFSWQGGPIILLQVMKFLILNH